MAVNPPPVEGEDDIDEKGVRRPVSPHPGPLAGNQGTIHYPDETILI